MLDQDKLFWMICNPERRASHPPRKMYRKLADAIRDQQTMAAKYPGQEFYVLQAVSLETTEKPAEVATEA